jgi:formylmethanofuran dehydrogenase subunit E
MGTNMENLQELLKLSAARHQHLCPRQVLGVRMGMLAGKVLNLPLPQQDKRLFAFVECDGCGLTGVSVATGCWVDRRTMRVMDYGKLAATFVDTQTGRAVRITPSPNCREIAQEYSPQIDDQWRSQLESYQIMPDEVLLNVQPVRLTVSLEEIISLPGLRVCCDSCGEEITNQRQVLAGKSNLCRSCAGNGYYEVTQSDRRRSEPLDLAAASGGDQTPTYARPSIPVITIIGKPLSGKTTLIEKLLGELSARGYKVATVKHHSHAGFDIDVPGKDSWRFSQAGSRHVVISAPDKIASYRLLDRELELVEIIPSISGVDLILAEGFRFARLPSLETVRSEKAEALVGSPSQLIAVASSQKLDTQVPLFDLDDVPGIAGFIEERYLA